MSPNMQMSVDVSLCGSIPRKLLLPTIPSTVTNSKCVSRPIARIYSANRRTQQQHDKIITEACLKLLLPKNEELSRVIKPSFPQNSPRSIQMQLPPLNPPHSQVRLQPSTKKMSSLPSWASPARGDAFLEPIPHTTRTNSSVDLTLRRYFSFGRSPTSDVTLLHATSSRQHAFVFHHPSGACFVIDCNSAHGTFVNGKRVPSHPHPPTRVRHGTLLRFGGPGSPSYLLKSFPATLDDIVQDFECAVKSASATQDGNPEEESTMRMSSQISRVNLPSFSKDHNGLSVALIALNTRLNALGSRGSKALDDKFPSLKVVIRSCGLSDNQVSSGAKRPRTVSYDRENCFEPPPKKPKSILTVTSSVIYSSLKAIDVAIIPTYAKKAMVRFSDEAPSICHPPSVTPDERSEDGDKATALQSTAEQTLTNLVILVSTRAPTGPKPQN